MFRIAHNYGKGCILSESKNQVSGIIVFSKRHVFECEVILAIYRRCGVLARLYGNGVICGTSCRNTAGSYVNLHIQGIGSGGTRIASGHHKFNFFKLTVSYNKAIRTIVIIVS